MSAKSDWEYDQMDLASLCWCERSQVRVPREYVKLGLTRPCKVRECLAMAVKKLHDPGGTEVLRDRFVIQNFRNARYDLKTLGLA